jgi:hypothetical protein
MKMYEPAMRHLLDTYIRAEESEKLSAFDDLTLVLIGAPHRAAPYRAFSRDHERADADVAAVSRRDQSGPPGSRGVGVLNEMALHNRWLQRTIRCAARR